VWKGFAFKVLNFIAVLRLYARGRGWGGRDENRSLAKAKQLEPVAECVDQWDLIPLPEYTYNS